MENQTQSGAALPSHDLLGLLVWRRKSGTEATYEVVEVAEHAIKLKPTHGGGRTTWKSKAWLMRDYCPFCPVCGTAQRLGPIGICDDCYL